MENCHLEEPSPTRWLEPTPCLGCSALEPEDCQCPPECEAMDLVSTEVEPEDEEKVLWKNYK